MLSWVEFEFPLPGILKLLQQPLDLLLGQLLPVSPLVHPLNVLFLLLHHLLVLLLFLDGSLLSWLWRLNVV